LAVPALLCDIIFLSWIYSALCNMLKELREKNETYKLKMYSQLAFAMASFVTLSTTLTVVMLASEGSEMTWEWEWQWANVVSWEALNFVVLAAVCTIWRPNEHSSMLAYSKQLATSEEGADDEDGVEMRDSSGMPTAMFTIEGDDADGREDDDDDDDDELPISSGWQKGESGGSGKGQDSGVTYSLSEFAPQPRSDLT
ncbi:unnamed protein product, partial [Choristocarpus tenellus]